MNINFQQSLYDTDNKSRSKKEEQRKRAPRKNGTPAYYNLNDFLNQYPIATVNEYGAQVISGIRIC